MTSLPWPLLVPFALLGSAIGSFLNVVVYRVPRGESVLFPASHCPRCDQPILNRHNVPVLGWLVLRGRCASCALPISARYPLVEAATGAAFVAGTVAVGISWTLPVVLVMTAVLITGALIGFDKARAGRATASRSARSRRWIRRSERRPFVPTLPAEPQS